MLFSLFNLDVQIIHIGSLFIYYGTLVNISFVGKYPKKILCYNILYLSLLKGLELHYKMVKKCI